MSSTTSNIGLDESGRNSSKKKFTGILLTVPLTHKRTSGSVLKPPGGDCHDLFGADFHGTPSHHRVLKPPGGGTSDIFTNPIDETDKRISNGQENGITTNGIDKHGNEIEKPTNPNPAVLSSGDGVADETPKQESKPAFVPASSMVRNCVTGEGCQTQEHYAIRVVPQREGNPVTGEGYDDPKNQQSAVAPSRTRIPPGGYSSGLW